MDPETTILVDYLEQTLALEQQLGQTLATHAAQTPEGGYRDLLDGHHQATADHVRRLGERLQQFGTRRSLPAVAFGLLQGTAHQAIALAGVSLSRIRSVSAEEQLVRDARQELAGAAGAIALYDIVAALAAALRDTETGVLAREHRARELAFADELRDLLPGLAGALVRERPAKAGAGHAEAAPATGGPAGGIATDHGGEALPLELPIEDYDRLTVAQILPRLEQLSADELAAVEGYEHAGRARREILDRVHARRTRATNDLLSRLS